MNTFPRRADYYRFLGLPRRAGQNIVQERCDTLLDWLASDEIPEELRPWAVRQAALIEHSYAVLSGAVPSPTAADRAEIANESTLLGYDAPGATRSARGPVSPPIAMLLVGVLAGVVVMGGALLGARLVPGWLKGSAVTAAPQAAVAGSGPTASEAAATAAALRPVVAPLEARIAAVPTDAAALFDLGETYMGASQWQLAVDWFGRLLSLDPSTVPPTVDVVHAQTDVGIAYMNLGLLDRAQPALTAALARKPDSPQIHYSLGYLFASGQIPDLSEATRHWQETIRLAPGSEWARAAQGHIDGKSATNGR